MNLDDVNFISTLKGVLSELKDKRLDALKTGVSQALVELHAGNREDGNWERVRRAIFLLENEFQWLARSDIEVKDE